MAFLAPLAPLALSWGCHTQPDTELAAAGGTEPHEAGSAEPSPSARACAITYPEDEPEKAALGNHTPATSQLVLTALVPTKRLATELDKQVPRGLAAEKRKPVGAAGEVTYNVTRGAFGFGLKGDRLVVSTPVFINVSICKPFGPLCPTYGTCTPKLNASVSVPLTLSSDYGVAKSHAGYAIAEGCTIAGMDQTGRIRSIADARMGAIQSQVDGSIPDVRALAKSALKEATQPRPLGEGCVRFEVDRIRQGKPALDAEALSLTAAVTGKVILSSKGCSKTSSAAFALPPLSVDASLDASTERSELLASSLLPWAEFEAALRQRLVGQTATFEEGAAVITALSVKPVAGKANAVAVGLTTAGSACGETWITFTAAPDMTSTTPRIALVDPSHPAPHVAFEALAKLVIAKSPVAFPMVAHASAELDAAAKLKPPTELDVNVVQELGPKVASVDLNREGLALTLTRSAKVRATAVSR